ncbi:MAG: ribonuclease III [Flavobacteriaceae bacterium]|nr:ribonuclease III [Flavobacteriaceae bacterium]
MFKSQTKSSGNFLFKLKNELDIISKNKDLFKKAFTHSSMNIKDSSGKKINYERLEFLGDSIFSLIITQYLFNNFPKAEEGDLTKLKAKIVSRENLNSIGKKMNLLNLIETTNQKNFGKNIHGNLLESLLGALFLDQGFEITKNYIIKKIIKPYVNKNSLNILILSYKSLILELAQKRKRKITFKTIFNKEDGDKIYFSSNLYLDEKFLCKSSGTSKKKAEENVSKKSFDELKLKLQ